MKKLIIIFVLIFLPVVNVQAKDITVKNMTLHVSKGINVVKETKKINVIPGDGVKIKSVRGLQPKSDTVKVSLKGKVTALKAGKTAASVRVKYVKDGKTKTVIKKYKIKVVKAKMKLSNKEVHLNVGEQYKLELKYQTEYRVYWSIDRADVVSFGKYGDGYTYIKADEPGEAVVICKCDGKKFKCKFIVDGENTEE